MYKRMARNLPTPNKKCPYEWKRASENEIYIWQNDGRNQVNLHFDGKVFVCAINAAGGPAGTKRGKKQSHKTNDPAKKERKKNLKYTNIFMIIFPNNNVEKMHIKHKHQNMAHCCCGMWNRQRLTIQILFKASKSNTEFYSNSYTYLPISRPRCLSFRLDECFSLLWTLCCARMYFMVHILYSRRYRLVSHIIDGIFTFSAILPMSNRIEILFTLDRPFQAYEQISRCAYCESHEKRWTHSFR